MASQYYKKLKIAEVEVVCWSVTERSWVWFFWICCHQSLSNLLLQKLFGVSAFRKRTEKKSLTRVIWDANGWNMWVALGRALSNSVEHLLYGEMLLVTIWVVSLTALWAPRARSTNKGQKWSFGEMQIPVWQLMQKDMSWKVRGSNSGAKKNIFSRAISVKAHF